MQTKLKSLTLVDQVNEQILKLVEDNGLSDGDSLPSIGELAETYGASRAVIRESLKSLEAQGVIEVANGKRATVKPVTSEPLLNYFHRALRADKQAAAEFAEIRMALELQCVALVIERGTDAELAAMTATVNDMRANLKDAEAFADLDVKFHLQIAHATHNQMMVHFLESLRGAIRESIQRGLQKRLTRAQMESVQGYHEHLLQNLIERDIEGATAAMHAHFDEIAMAHE